MTEKEKNILTQELWALVSLGFDATKHDFEIMEKILKCVSKEDSGEMTPYKRKVIEELQLEWRFLKSIHEDLAAIAIPENFEFGGLSGLTNEVKQKLANGLQNIIRVGILSRSL